MLTTMDSIPTIMDFILKLMMFNYGGGTDEAKFRPLEANSFDYDLAWAQYMGYGVAGVCWRGPSTYSGE